MMSDKQEYIQTENGTSPKSSKKHSCARHCKRFWWIWAIILVIGAVLAVVICIFAIVPRIAQDKVDEAKLDIQGTNVLETTTNSLLMQINTTITTHGGIKAQVDAFDGVMYLEDDPAQAPFVNLRFPHTNNNKHQIVNISQHVDIQDHEAINRFNVWFHNNKTLRVTVAGKPKVHPDGLARKSKVNFKKTVTINGLNTFSGAEILDGQISFKPDGNGNNFNGTAKIPNASFFTLDIGNASFANFINHVPVGFFYMNNVMLVPGDNVINVNANLNQTYILETLQQRPYCETGIIPFDLWGTGVQNNGQSLGYFAAALASVNQTVDINIGKIIKNSLGTTIGCKD